jgi:hypothetical protein
MLMELLIMTQLLIIMNNHIELNSCVMDVDVDETKPILDNLDNMSSNWSMIFDFIFAIIFSTLFVCTILGIFLGWPLAILIIMPFIFVFLAYMTIFARERIIEYE